jgi:hypothetical protein
MTKAAAPELVQIKQQAFELKKATGCSHAKCLEAIAHQRGFRTYAALLASIKNPPPGPK